MASRSRVDPDGLIAAWLLGLLGTAGMFYVNVMPAIVAGLRDSLGYTNRQAGYVAAANVYGAAVGALCAVFLVRRVAWRRVEVAALVLLILLDAASTLVVSPPLLVALRALDGLFGGVSVGIALAVMARTRLPQRAYGAQFTLQLLLGGLGLMWLPQLAAHHGAYVLFLALGTISALTLALLALLPEYPLEIASKSRPDGSTIRLPLAATLVALFSFQAANMGLFAFIFPLAHFYGLQTGFISNTLGVADWAAAAGSLLAMWTGSRFGRLKPLGIVLLLTILATFALLRSDVALVFIAANVASGIAWSFVVPCLFSMCAAFDPTGRSASLGGFFSKLGLGSGPLLAPFVIGANRYPLLVYVSIITIVATMLATAWPALRLDRAR